MLSEYDAVVQVISEHMEALNREIKRLKDERREIRDDPNMGYDCPEYREVVTELHSLRHQRIALEGLCDGLESRVRELLQADAMGQL